MKELQRFSQWCRWIFVRLHNRRIFKSAMLPSVYYKTVVWSPRSTPPFWSVVCASETLVLEWSPGSTPLYCWPIGAFLPLRHRPWRAGVDDRRLLLQHTSTVFWTMCLLDGGCVLLVVLFCASVIRKMSCNRPNRHGTKSAWNVGRSLFGTFCLMHNTTHTSVQNKGPHVCTLGATKDRKWVGKKKIPKV